jgi:hypothetical protein
MISTCMLATHDSNASKPSKVYSTLFVFLLLLIHTIDMILTRQVVGDDWWRETFLPMSYCIKWFGIYNALWISRVCIYSSLFIYFLNRKKWAWYYFLVTGTILYWTAMVPWLWTLGYINWPH